MADNPPRTLSGRGARDDREPLLSASEDRGEGPSRNRAVSLTASIASFKSAASSLSNFHIPRVSSSHSRQASASASTIGKRRDSSDLLEPLSDNSEDEHASLLDLSDLEEDFDLDYDEEAAEGSDEPLVRRRRKRFDDEPGDKNLFEVG